MFRSCAIRLICNTLHSNTISRQNYTNDCQYQFINVQRSGVKRNVGVLSLGNAPSMNILYSKLNLEAIDALKELDADESVAVIVLTGNEKAFSAGGDIKELINANSYAELIKKKPYGEWEGINQIKKPIIAAVNGFAYGGGFIVALRCDIIYAGETAVFNLPEVSLGTTPLLGATNCFTRTAGRYKAMEFILAGKTISAREASEMGLVSKVFPSEKLLEETIKIAEKISQNSSLMVSLAKECVNTALETTLAGGLNFERRISYGSVATKDYKEGVTAFLEKRQPTFTNE